MKCFKLSNNHSHEGDDDITVIGDTQMIIFLNKTITHTYLIIASIADATQTYRFENMVAVSENQ